VGGRRNSTTPDGEALEELGVNVLSGVKVTVEALKQIITTDLQLSQMELAK
jgi:hypothetical protein